MQLNSWQLARVLDVWPVARLATLDKEKRPQLIPIVFVAIDGMIYSPVDGKPKRSENLQRLRNVARNGAVSVLLDHYVDDWQALWWLRIDAEAEVVEGNDLPPHEFERIDTALGSKYPQYELVAKFGAVPTLLRIRPLRHVAWSAQSIDWEGL